MSRFYHGLTLIVVGGRNKTRALFNRILSIDKFLNSLIINQKNYQTRLSDSGVFNCDAL